LSNARLDVLAAACPDFPDLQAHLERTVALEDPVFLVPLDSPDAHPQCAKSLHHHHAGLAHLDHPDLRDHPEALEPLDAPGHQAVVETTVPPELPAHRDHPAQLETLDKMDSPETQDPQLSLSHSSPETPDHREMLAHKVFPETQEPPAATASPETPAPRDHPAHLDLRDHPETMDSPDLADPPDLRENVVCARNIALWMVVFSSRMEQGDKLFRPADSVNFFVLLLGLSIVPIFCHTEH
jgi:hypothetical protein